MSETDRDFDMRDVRARIIVLETIQNQMLVTLARISGSPESILQGLMQAAERSLHAAAGAVEAGDAQQSAADAIKAFNDRSMRLIAALTPNTSKN